MNINPFAYQVPAIKAGLKGLRSPSKRALIDMATALGKTLTSAFIAKKFGARRILFLAHNNYILKNAVDEFRLIFGEKVNMIIYNGMFRGDAHGVDIVFASWQTMGKRLKQWKRNHFDLIIVDEAHHTYADTYRPVADYFTGAKLGITATPDRSDDADIREVFGKEVFRITLEEAIARGLLPRIEYHVVTDESLDEEALQKIAQEIKVGKKRFTMAEVNRRIFIKKRDVEITRIINGYNEKALVFYSSISHAERMKKTLKLSKTFHSSTGVSQKMTWDKNQMTLDELRDGIIRRVCAVNAFNEGVNVPSIGLVAFCRVTESVTIFRQQLGRGLRRGKDRLVVLDFVGNLERIQMVMEIMNKISDLHEQFTPREEIEREGYVRQRFEVSGKGFEFTFSDKVVDLMKVLEHCEREFYPTWQEASDAIGKLSIKTYSQYKRLYKTDPRLPSCPNETYPNFPGFRVFFGKAQSFYLTWQEASRAAQRLGVSSKKSYLCLYKKDSRLPSQPNVFYSNYPGLKVFLGGKEKNRYGTWQLASKAAQKLGIKTHDAYIRAYRKDPNLPSCPNVYYSDFPGYPMFLRGIKKKMYPTWKQASKAARKLGITTQSDYRARYKLDPRLPSLPENQYPDFPGCRKFFNTKKNFYDTWQRAGKAARHLGITSQVLYSKNYRKDSRLPSDPGSRYKNFPGWPKFLGKHKK